MWRWADAHHAILSRVTLQASSVEVDIKKQLIFTSPTPPQEPISLLPQYYHIIWAGSEGGSQNTDFIGSRLLTQLILHSWKTNWRLLSSGFRLEEPRPSLAEESLHPRSDKLSAVASFSISDSDQIRGFDHFPWSKIKFYSSVFFQCCAAHVAPNGDLPSHPSHAAVCTRLHLDFRLF